MTLAQLEEQVADLKETFEERMAALERTVERLGMQLKAETNAVPSSGEERKEREEEDLIPGTEYDLVISVPPKDTLHIVGKIASIEVPPADLGLSDAEWANYASEDEDE